METPDDDDDDDDDKDVANIEISNLNTERLVEIQNKEKEKLV